VKVQSKGSAVVAVFEVGQVSGDPLQIEKVVGIDDFALNDREDGLDLVEPGGVNGQVDEPQTGPGAFKRVDGGLSAMAAAVVDDPEHPLGRRVMAWRS
jgi:hypothetical protein